MPSWCGELKGESNYLEEIESAYGQCREKWSMLSPLDWQLAGEWEKDGIPIFIVLAAIDDCCKKYKANREPGKINTLRYFDQAVRQRFAVWARGRIGAHNQPVSADHVEDLEDDPEPFEPSRPCGTCTGSMFIITARDPVTLIATAMVPCPECAPKQTDP